MDKLFLDTNYLLDLAVADRGVSETGEDCHASAVRLYELFGTGMAMGFVSAGSLKDFYYIAMRGGFGHQVASEWIRLFMDSFLLVPLNRFYCEKALESGEADFEDALIRVMSEDKDVDYLLTRDASAFLGSSIKKLTPESYLLQRR